VDLLDHLQLQNLLKIRRSNGSKEEAFIWCQ